MTYEEEREFLRNNSPDALPLDTAESGWTAEQIRQLFVTPLYFLLEILQSTRLELGERDNGQDVEINELKTRVQNIIGGTQSVGRALADINGSSIIATYETKADALNKLTEAKNYADLKIDQALTFATNSEIRALFN